MLDGNKNRWTNAYARCSDRDIKCLNNLTTNYEKCRDEQKQEEKAWHVHDTKFTFRHQNGSPSSF